MHVLTPYARWSLAAIATLRRSHVLPVSLLSPRRILLSIKLLSITPGFASADRNSRDSSVATSSLQHCSTIRTKGGAVLCAPHSAVHVHVVFHRRPITSCSTALMWATPGSLELQALIPPSSRTRVRRLLSSSHHARIRLSRILSSFGAYNGVLWP